MRIPFPFLPSRRDGNAISGFTRRDFLRALRFNLGLYGATPLFGTLPFPSSFIAKNLDPQKSKQLSFEEVPPAKSDIT